MESYIKKAIDEAVQIRREYTASYDELRSVDLDFSETEMDPASIDKAKVHWHGNQLAYYNGALIEADMAGVTIKTDDYYALEKAQWQNVNIAPGQDLYSPVEAMRLDALTNEDLERNLQRYSEMTWEFSETELAQSRDIITHLPLTHTTQESALLEVMSTSSERADILSYAKLREYHLTANGFSSGGVKGFSAALDEKMGLNNYVFMCLGLPHPGQGNDGRTGIAVIDSGILYNDNCIVTPDDISNMCPDVFHGAGVEYQRDLDSLDRYRSTAVSGRGWIEVLTRRLAKHRRESPDTPYPVQNCFTMGEIKYRDQVPRSAILALLTSEAEIQTYLRQISSNAIAWPSYRTFLS